MGAPFLLRGLLLLGFVLDGAYNVKGEIKGKRQILIETTESNVLLLNFWWSFHFLSRCSAATIQFHPEDTLPPITPPATPLHHHQHHSLIAGATQLKTSIHQSSPPNLPFSYLFHSENNTFTTVNVSHLQGGGR